MSKNNLSKNINIRTTTEGFIYTILILSFAVMSIMLCITIFQIIISPSSCDEIIQKLEEKYEQRTINTENA